MPKQHNALRLCDELAPELSQDEDLHLLLAQFERLDVLIQQQLHTLQQRFAEPEEALQGLALSPEELEHLNTQRMGIPFWALEQSDQQLSTEAIDPRSRLGQLVNRFALSDFERDVLLLCLLPLFDSRYSLLFAYMQENNQKKSLTVDFALNILCPGVVEKTAQLASLLPQARLLKNCLLTFTQRSGEHWGNALLHPATEIYSWLIGHAAFPGELRSCASWLTPSALADLLVPLTQRLAPYCADAGVEVKTLVQLQGRPGSGRAMAIARAAASVGKAVLALDLAQLPEDDETAQSVLSVALRETRLQAGCLLLRSLADFSTAHPRLMTWLGQALSQSELPIFCLTEPHASLMWLEGMAQVVIAMPTPAFADQVALLASRLEGIPQQPDIDIAGLVKRFHPSSETLVSVLHEAQAYCQQRGENALLSNTDLYHAFGLRSQQDFGNLAQRITPVRGFDDLIISDDLQQHLNEVLAAIRQREQVLGQGFGRKVGYGTGISALFHGDSGTGKTMVAEVLAGALGVDLIKVDLSTVMNKYIGETEKNLSRIFDCAEADAGVLFFDEADALFGKRSETKDAKDRHANIEVSYLLQRLESYPGLVVLATNNRSHLDDAFSRRLTFILRFTFPDQTLRERMWRAIWPAETPVAEDVDFSSLARRAEITGANIRNAAMLASWLAAEEQSPHVAMHHIERALQRELGKVGRLVLSR
ncbi:MULTISPECIES: ATP-binding protein [Pseudomonas]|uniref:ATP-binding protein n=1 Tax=Pseudomonas TaxID=286 RepID=UPI000B35A973|nr:MULTISPECIES: AAA family ATPase [Pseudomonas]PMY35968.1 ATP-dependent zinc metalloprotease FtsH [Pseudomonas sp. GW456-L14]PMY46361.1 ATP-dependent zinc metalloprotease FtsH [Pseudomonas sp. GW456-L12]PMY64821.1 ATP-dependent zinc metalloprotease FtsH [Pseudomonas sp. FW305-25]PMY69259.1 ATP-dependent zinc metalloprotease FtsH [Pseudomonas sp. FW126-L8]PNA80052.1 ATP-dependent zinc metalloprotease FtsH [Pseudomonas sp. FW305-76]